MDSEIGNGSTGFHHSGFLWHKVGIWAEMRYTFHENLAALSHISLFI